MSQQQILYRYQRHADEKRGRCLVATGDIPRGRLIFVERPVIAMQSIGNSFEGVLVCSYCMAFCGSPKQALQVASDPSLLEDITTTNVSNGDKNISNKSPGDTHTLHCCRHNCGHIYCSLECQQDDWEWGGHQELCTGSIPEQDDSLPNQKQQVLDTSSAGKDEIDNNELSTETSTSDGEIPSIHPLLQFKIHSRETNEIFLLVATWLIRILKHDLPYCDDDKMQAHPYTDFQMNAWWEVKTAELLAQSDNNVAEATLLESTLKELCRESHSYLSQALLLTKQEEAASFNHSQWLTPMGMARLIGSLEQNCLGIRRKHALQHNVMNDTELRHELHTELIQCLEQTRLIVDDEDGDCGCDDDEDDIDGNNENENDNDDVGDDVDNKNNCSANGDDDNNAGINEDIESEYSHNDIASYLASLTRDLMIDCIYDEWDDFLRPLDGIAHYSIATKMNHSCDPNVILVYKTRGWGRDHPLVAYCVALKDIAPDEELTISYITSDEPYKKRQADLANYGFVCTCHKCHRENEDIVEGNKVYIEDINPIDEDNLFGDDDDDSDCQNDKEIDSHARATQEGDSSSEEREIGNDKRLSGEDNLQNVAERLESILNKSDHASIPIAYLAPASNYVIKEGYSLLQEMRSTKGAENKKIIEDLLEQNIHALRDRDFASCRIVGSDLELFLYKQLESNGSWLSALYRVSYWFASITSSIGYAHEGSFLVSMKYLDKATILGLDRKMIELYFGYVELFASQMAAGPCPVAIDCKISNFQCPKLKEFVVTTALSTPILFPVEKIINNGSNMNDVLTSCNQSNVCVIRGMISEWPALEKWRAMDILAREFGHRLVPIEIGSMGNGMKEAIVTFRHFVSKYLSSSATKDCWSLDDAIMDRNNVAYLAQHPLLNQIPGLCSDIDINPFGIKPTNINIWIGTGGTRTPLHFDSYDNLLVQLVGAKYVRLYDKECSQHLYVSNDSSFGGQGNMSELDCERENYERHPLAKDCNYKEVLLFPGDCLFIPSRHWHYVRSLSTSVSVNYWF